MQECNSSANQSVVEMSVAQLILGENCGSPDNGPLHSAE
jgi:hypothetical protein